MHVLWTVLTLILVIGSFLGLFISYSRCQDRFMRVCIGVGVTWVGYGVMLYLLSAANTMIMV